MGRPCGDANGTDRTPGGVAEGTRFRETGVCDEGMLRRDGPKLRAGSASEGSGACGPCPGGCDVETRSRGVGPRARQSGKLRLAEDDDGRHAPVVHSSRTRPTRRSLQPSEADRQTARVPGADELGGRRRGFRPPRHSRAPAAWLRGRRRGLAGGRNKTPASNSVFQGLSRGECGRQTTPGAEAGCHTGHTRRPRPSGVKCDHQGPRTPRETGCGSKQRRAAIGPCRPVDDREH